MTKQEEADALRYWELKKRVDALKNWDEAHALITSLDFEDDREWVREMLLDKDFG